MRNGENTILSWNEARYKIRKKGDLFQKGEKKERIMKNKQNKERVTRKKMLRAVL
jgi:hypothetical protein